VTRKLGFPLPALRRLQLSAKLCIALALVAIVGLMLGALTLDRALRPAFDRLEREAVDQQVARTETLLQTMLATVENSTIDYAVWDDSYAYALNGNTAFERDNLSVLGLANLDVNAIGYARLDGELLHALHVDFEREGPSVALSHAFGRFITSPRFAAAARERARFSEFTLLNGRLYAVGAAQILRSDGSGEPAGYVVMARQVSDASVSEALQTPSRITEMRDAQTSVTPEAWQVAVPIRDLGGSRIGSLQYELARDTSKLGAMSIASALLAGAAVMTGVLLAVLLLMRLLIIRRLEGVTRHVRGVAADGALVPLDEDQSGDELGSLNQSFNAMIRQLKELREQVKEQSFLLGQADLAASVIHNVRNSLNPVSVIIAQTLAEKLPLNEQDVTRALQELKSTDTAPERRERLAAFLLEGLGELERRAAGRREALSTAKEALAEALEILRSQNEAANRDIPVERFDLLELIQRNAEMSRFAPWDEVIVELPTESMEAAANPLLLSQVMANLMTNALESIVAAKRAPGRLSISLVREEGAGGALCKIVITDDGQGFDADAAARLFERGHSSKTRQGGFGLHWCANTIRAMGGSLTLESEGQGYGARATIVLPGVDKASAGTDNAIAA
jgi:signal transduction histidine kinase